jgi:hypothetical protein
MPKLKVFSVGSCQQSYSPTGVFALLNPLNLNFAVNILSLANNLGATYIMTKVKAAT